MGSSQGRVIKGNYYVSSFRQGHKWVYQIHDHTTEKEVLITEQSSTVSEEIAAGKAFMAMLEYFWTGPGRGCR